VSVAEELMQFLSVDVPNSVRIPFSPIQNIRRPSDAAAATDAGQLFVSEKSPRKMIVFLLYSCKRILQAATHR
jgi:hypothetical protein